MEALSQMWIAVHSWFTPTVLFVLVNVVIGTIAVTSGMRQNNNNTNRDLRRNPSLLDRITSFSLSRNKVEAPEYEYPEEKKAMAEKVTEYENQNQEEKEEMAENVAAVEEKTKEVKEKMGEERKSKVKSDRTSQRTHKSNELGRSKSDTPPTADLRPPPLPSKLKKSGTFESAFSHFDNQALSVLESNPEVVNTVESDDNGAEDAEEVDAKADDFINKFKQQLKLQRLESLMRYKDMINRGK